LDSILARAETVDAPLSRALAYSQVFTTLMMSSFDANRHLAGPLVPPRVDPDTPAGWMFAELRQDVRLQARIFAALDDLKKQSNHPALRGAEGLFRGMVLGSLDRPLEAIDAYLQTFAPRLPERLHHEQQRVAQTLQGDIAKPARRAAVS